MIILVLELFGRIFIFEYLKGIMNEIVNLNYLKYKNKTIILYYLKYIFNYTFTTQKKSLQHLNFTNYIVLKYLQVRIRMQKYLKKNDLEEIDEKWLKKKFTTSYCWT